MYNGLKFFSILIRDNMIGIKISEFIQTKKFGPNIHRKASKKNKNK
jgi:ribosomal protein S19